MLVKISFQIIFPGKKYFYQVITGSYITMKLFVTYLLDIMVRTFGQTLKWRNKSF